MHHTLLKAGLQLTKIIIKFLINGKKLKSFYPNLNSLGFEDAFNLTFGYSTEEFYEEFDSFLELPIEQQLEIIRDI